MKRIALIFFSVAMAAHAQQIGYRGDGFGNFPGAQPPTKDLAVKWETPLPAWGHGSPVAVAGKVFVLGEPYPGHYFPQLYCLDGATGKILWERELDHLGKDEETRQAWRELFDDVSHRRRLIAPYLKAKDSDAKAVAEKAITESGYEYNARWHLLDIADAGKSKEFGKRIKAVYDKAGLMFDGWYLGCGVNINCLGNAYATPVSDGKNLWVTTAWGSVFCFDLDGKQLWQSWSRTQKQEYCTMGRSPLLHKGQLLTAIGQVVRAFDAATGKLLWSHPLKGSAQGLDTGNGVSHSIITPSILTVGGIDILWAPGVTAYRLPDGKLLKVEGWTSEGFEALVNPEQPDILYVQGVGQHCSWHPKEGRKSPAAMKFTLAGETLKAEVLWDGLPGTPARHDGGPLGMACRDGKLFLYNGMVLDALTGKKIEGATGPHTYHLMLLGDKVAVGLDRSKTRPGSTAKRPASLNFTTLDGKPAGELMLDRTPHTPEQREMLLNCSANEEWGDTFTVGWTFALAGDKVYVRSLLNVICVGAK